MHKHVLILLPVVLFVVGCGSRGSGASEWKKYESKNGDFTAMFPTEWSYSKKEPPGGGAAVEIISAVDPNIGGTYEITVQDLACS